MTGKEPYDKIWTALKLFSDDCKAAQIPDTELPPAIADFLAMMIIAMSDTEELAEMGVDAINERMKNTLEDWKANKPPFG